MDAHQYRSILGGHAYRADRQQYAALFNSTLRPNVVSGVPLEMSYSNFNPAVDRYINRAAFAVPASFTFGSAARSYDSLRAPWN